jgi:uncharacterized protein YdeI (YjbR/CyaY-like superfamily)
LEQNHDSASEVWIGMWKAHTGRPSVTWAESVREALCFGWIDGQLSRIVDESHMQRFTPRKSRRWSAINVALVEELEAGGLVHEAGRRAFAARDLTEERYSLSERPDQLPPDLDARLRENPDAAAFWDASPAVLPEGGRVLGHGRQARGDPREALGDADRGLRERAAAQADAP